VAECRDFVRAKVADFCCQAAFADDLTGEVLHGRGAGGWRKAVWKKLARVVPTAVDKLEYTPKGSL